MPRILCAFDGLEAGGAALECALPLCTPGDGELFLLGGLRSSSWEPAGPTSGRRVTKRGTLSAALVLRVEQAWRAGVSARTRVCAADDLEREARMQAAAVGAERIVLAHAPRGIDRLLGRSPRVRTLRMQARRTLRSVA